MKHLNAQELYEAIGGVSDRHLLDALPPSLKPAPTPAPRRESRVASFFLDNGWVAAVLSAVVAVGLIVAIVLGGRQDPAEPPIGGTAGEYETAVESESILGTEQETDTEPESVVETDTESETAAVLDPDPFLNPLDARCNVRVYHDQTTTYLNHAYIFKGEFQLETPEGIVYHTPSGNPIGADYLRSYLCDPAFPTIQITDISTFRLMPHIDADFQLSSSDTVYDANLEEIPNAKITTLSDGIYYVVTQVTGRGGTHTIGYHKYKSYGGFGYCIPYRLVVGDVTYPTADMFTIEDVFTPINGVTVTTADGESIMDKGFLYSANLQETNGTGSLTIDRSPLSRLQVSTLIVYTATPRLVVRTSEGWDIRACIADADHVASDMTLFDCNGDLLDADVQTLPAGKYGIYADLRVTGGTHTVDGKTYTGDADYSIFFILVVEG